MNSVEDIKKLTLPELGDYRGRLVVVEGGEGRQIPFIMKRVFYIYGSDAEVVRGSHANRYSQFCLINVCGTSKVRAIDQSSKEKVFILDAPNMGIYLPAMIWKEMYGFSDDSILLVLSSEYYDKNEYIRDFEAFLKGDGK